MTGSILTRERAENHDPKIPVCPYYRLHINY